MSKRREFLSDVSWFQVAGSALAAVTAAWIASKLGVAGTLVGAALGSFVVTLSSAFYTRTLHHGRTLLVHTEHGTVIERSVEDGEVSEAFAEAKELDSPVVGAEFVDEKPTLHWKTILATTAVVLAVAMAAITTYELLAKHPLGDSGSGTTIGDTFGGHKDTPTQKTPTKSATTPTATTPTAVAPRRPGATGPTTPGTSPSPATTSGTPTTSAPTTAPTTTPTP